MKYKIVKKYLFLPIILILIITCLTGCSIKNRSDVEEYLNQYKIFKNDNNTYKISLLKTRVKTTSKTHDYVWTIKANINGEDIEFYVIEEIDNGGPFSSHSLNDTYNYSIMDKVLENVDLKSFTIEEKIQENYAIKDNKLINEAKIAELNHSGSTYILKNSFVSQEDFNEKMNELFSIIEQTSKLWKPIFDVELDDVNNISTAAYHPSYISSIYEVEELKKSYEFE